MPFEIDTGFARTAPPRMDKVQVLLDTAGDMAGDNATQGDVDYHLSRLIVADLVRPKTAATVRRHFISMWPAVAPLAERSPAAFDFIIAEFFERLAELG